MLTRIYCLLAIIWGCHTLHAQEAVSVGRGSYAAKPPLGKVVDNNRKVDLVQEVEESKLYLVNDDGRPIPSNKWYQNLLLKQYGTGLWSLPHKVDATNQGLELYYPTQFAGDGTRMIADFPLLLTAKEFRPIDSRAKSWSDWLVSFRLFESEQKYIDVTLGEGMPYVWAECHGVAPQLEWGGVNGRGSRGKNVATFFTLQGQPQTLPCTTDVLGITYEGRSYGLFLPTGTTLSATEHGLSIQFAGDKQFVVLCPLPKAEDLPLFYRYAFAIPRETQLSWKYKRAAGQLQTDWQINAEALQGTNQQVLQGFLPHHYRDNVAKLEFLGPQFTTIRGQLKYAAGNQFTITYPFQGVLPNFPAPSTEHGFSPERMQQYFTDHFINDKQQLARDTYAGGKDLTRYAQAALMSQQLKAPQHAAILNKVRSELENWLTYTPGEKDRYFAYYPRRKGLVGFNVSFGSQHFTDHHFHLGYFAFAAGVVSQLSPDFASDYGDLARLVVKSYANYERTDNRFPFLRTFDIWRGHSFADGKGFPDGNNQESTGEALNSWVGMILLGEALGDEQMTATGVMGYCFESRANLEYWFDPHGDIFHKSYQHRACGMIWCNSIVWGTWFTASPGWIYGIQWLPPGPFYSFYDRDRKFIMKTYFELMGEMDAFEAKEAAKKPGSIKKGTDLKALGGELGSYHLGFLMHANPWLVIKQLDKYYADPDDKVAHDQWMTSIYYQAHALQELGHVDWQSHGDRATSTVYINGDQRTMVAWNPTAQQQIVIFSFPDQKPVALRVPAHSFAREIVIQPTR
jgi:endoglucanase Acf2